MKTQWKSILLWISNEIPLAYHWQPSHSLDYTAIFDRKFTINSAGWIQQWQQKADCKDWTWARIDCTSWQNFLRKALCATCATVPLVPLKLTRHSFRDHRGVARDKPNKTLESANLVHLLLLWTLSDNKDHASVFQYSRNAARLCRVTLCECRQSNTWRSRSRFGQDRTKLWKDALSFSHYHKLSIVLQEARKLSL